MELISEYFSWCEKGRRSGINPGDRVSGNTSEEEEARPLKLEQMDRMKYIYILGGFWHFTSS